MHDKFDFIPIQIARTATPRRQVVSIGLNRIAISAAFFVSFLAFPGQSQAQASQEVPLPTTFPIVDDNGVDLSSGQVGLTVLQASVGEEGAGGLNQTYTVGAFLRDNLHGSINQKQNTSEFSVTIGRASAKFLRQPSGAFTPDSGAAGQSLVLSAGIYTYTLQDGTVATFNSALKTTETSAPGQDNIALLANIARPNGEAISYNYSDYVAGCSGTCSKLLSVVSSLGYMVKYEYQTDAVFKHPAKVTAINLAVEYCSPTAETCSLTRPWPSTTFSGPQIGAFTATDASGRTTSYNIGVGLGRTAVIQRPSGASKTYTFDSSPSDSRVVSYTDGTGTWGYGYGYDIAGNHISTTVTNPLGKTRTVTFDPTLQAPLSDTDELGRTTSYTLQAITGLVTRVTQPEGNYTNYTYNANGAVTEVRRVAKSGSGLPDHVVTATYPTVCNPKTCNKPVSIVDGGAQTDLSYDQNHGGVLTVTGPMVDGVRPETRYAYQALSASYLTSAGVVTPSSNAVYKLIATSTCKTQASCLGTSDEVTGTINYNAANTAAAAGATNRQRSSVVDAAGDGSLSATTSFTYDANGDLHTTTGPLGGSQTTRERRDNMRRLAGRIEIDPDGQNSGRPSRATRYTYDNDGRLSLVEHGSIANQSDAGWSSFSTAYQEAKTYNGRNQPALSTLSGGGTLRSATQHSYDSVGRRTCTAVRMNLTVAMPGSACDLGAEGSFGPDRITRTGYLDDGRVSDVEDAYQLPIHRTATYTYTPNGQVQTVTDGEGNRTTYAYDGFDRRLTIAYPSKTNPGTSSSTDYYQALSYNPNTWDLLSERRRDGQAVNYTYDALHRVRTKSNPSSSYAYDNLDRRTSATQGGQTLTWNYDALGRVTSAGGPLGTVAYQYNLAGYRTRMTWPDAFYVTYDNDNTGAMTAIRENGAASGPGVLATFDYDPLGRRSSLTRGNGVVTTYGYDPIARLSSLSHNLAGTAHDQSWTFSHNPASQILTRVGTNSIYSWSQSGGLNRTYTINGLNQVATASTATTFGYDDRGNLTSDGTNSYGYDIDNRLTSSGSTTLAYDAADRLYQLTPSAGPATRFGYDGVNAMGEYNSSNILQRRYVHGPRDDEPLVWYEGAGTSDRRWLIADHAGSVAGVTDSSGVAVAINTYDEYGVGGTTNVGRFQYTGQVWLNEIGLYNYKARNYSPTIGRFMQPDPEEYTDSLNLYAYVGADPVNLIDPTGRLGVSLETEVAPIGVFGRQSPSVIALRLSKIASYGIRFGPGIGLISNIVEPSPLGDATLMGSAADKLLQLIKKSKLSARQSPNKRMTNYDYDPDGNGGPQGGEQAARAEYRNLGLKNVVDREKGAAVGFTRNGTEVNLHNSKINGWTIEFKQTGGYVQKFRFGK